MKCQVMFSRKNKKKYYKISSVENFTQQTKCSVDLICLVDFQPFSKEDNFCDFLFAFLYIMPLLKSGVLFALFSEWRQNNFASAECISAP